jgi:hypothetical protein
LPPCTHSWSLTLEPSLATLTLAVNLLSLLEESVSSFLRSFSPTAIHGSGPGVKPEPAEVPRLIKGSSPFNASGSHGESNAVPSSGALDIESRPVVPFPLPAHRLRSFTGLPSMRENISPFKGPFDAWAAQLIRSRPIRQIILFYLYPHRRIHSPINRSSFHRLFRFFGFLVYPNPPSYVPLDRSDSPPGLLCSSCVHIKMTKHLI